MLYPARSPELCGSARTPGRPRQLVLPWSPLPPPPEPSPASRRSTSSAIATAAAVTLGVTAWLVWPLPLHLQTMHAVTDFGDGHVWVFDRIARFVTGQLPFSTSSSDAGFPSVLDGRFLGWGPALLALPLRPFLGAVGAYNLVLLLTPTLGTLAAWLLLREATRCSPWVAAAAAVPYGLCPYGIASLTNGQIEKAQIWIYPLYLWLLFRAIHGPRRALPLAAIPVTILAAVFTCPYFGLALPLVAVPLAIGLGVHRTWRGNDGVRPLIAAGLALVLTAAATAPAGTYYSTAIPGRGPEIPSMFRPADAPCPADGHTQRFQNSPSAEPRATLLGATKLHVGESNHITYLLLPLVIVAGIGLLVSAPGRWSGLLIFVVGATIAAGPQLVADGMYQTRHGLPYMLPMTILEQYGYPLRYGGQYYRAIAIASLGLSMLMASGLSRLPRRWGVAVGVVLAAVCVRDFLQFWQRLTPWPTATMPGQIALTALARSPEPGAVLALPFLGSQIVGSYGLLEATIHQRPTSAVARAVREIEAPHFAPWVSQLPAAAAEHRLPELLRGLGFRYAVLTLQHVREQEDDLPELRESALTATFGPPTVGDGVLIWDLGG